MTSSDTYFDGVFADEELGNEGESGAELFSDITGRIAETTNTSSKTVIAVAAAIATVVLVLFGIVFYMMISTGRNAATGIKNKPTVSASTSASSATPTPEPTAEETFTLDEGRARLADLVAQTTCQAEDDADFLTEFSRMSAEAGTWAADKAEVDARLKELPGKCGEGYALIFATKLRSPVAPDGLKELVETTLADVGTDKRPAPEGAIDLTGFSTPSRNIHCEFSDEGVSCTIYQYSYDSTACQGQPVTYSVLGAGETAQSCDRQISSGTTISYGTTVARGGFACTASSSGVECWHERTGKGFMLNSGAVQTF